MAEEQHEIGKEYLECFNGLLIMTLKHLSYQKLYDAYKNETRVTFEVNGRKISFDSKGTIEYDGEKRDVWVESKGYSEGSNLLDSYKEFIKRAYEVVISNEVNENDIFIFVTNAPFGSSVKNIFKKEYIMKILLTEYGSLDIAVITKINKISENIFGMIFTDSYIKLLTNNKKIQTGDSLWNIWRNRQTKDMKWETFKDMFRVLNPDIKDLNKIKLGDIVTLPKI